MPGAVRRRSPNLLKETGGNSICFPFARSFNFTESYGKRLLSATKRSRSVSTPFKSKVDPDKKPHGDQPDLELRSALYCMSGVDLIGIDGFDVLTIQTIISEVGLDMARWPTEKHLASWLRHCPN